MNYELKFQFSSAENLLTRCCAASLSWPWHLCAWFTHADKYKLNQCQPSWRRNYFLSGDLVLAILFVSISDLKGQRGKLLKERLARFFLIIWTRVIAVWFQLLADDEPRRLMGIRDQYHLSLLLPPYHPSQREKKNSFRTLWKTQ